MSPSRWQELMRRWDAPANDDVFRQLQAAYTEPQRRYHTTAHIEACLVELDEVASGLQHSEEVEMALWFHDAVYKPISSKNELHSAQWAQSFLQSIGASEDRCRRVYSYILATRHEPGPLVGDAAIVVDIDLSILGQQRNVYDSFERAIREEYQWVPWPIYRRKRAEILNSFLGRAQIYETEHFRSRYEARARQNLGDAIERLRK